MELEIQSPMVIASSVDVAVIVSAADVDNVDAPAQLYVPGDGYSQVKPLQVHLKWLYIINDINPPEPWIEPS